MEIKKETCYHVQCLGKWVHNSKPTQGRTTRRRGGPRGGRGSRAAGLRGTGRARGRQRGVRRRGQGQRGRGGGGSRVAATAGDDLEGRLHGPGRRGARRRGRGRRRPRKKAAAHAGGLGDVILNLAKG
ncbi:hypothetical protein PVAP13_3NG052090 [Panicum virgatum]|uniref:Uncharacterized protein n=1 Tax=Panicum virgatum TaxID=38727 RepID=A0A8T0TXP4_PANVG|nr:hypothetical protein PVAP13_3NG052090 [Panicum virgatum]